MTRIIPVFILMLLAFTAQGEAQISNLKDPKWTKVRKEMEVISRQLGVTCTHCHSTKNFKDASMKTYKIAKKHMNIVEILNTQHKNALAQRVDCYMCHRGKAIPDYKEKVSPY